MAHRERLTLLIASALAPPTTEPMVFTTNTQSSIGADSCFGVSGRQSSISIAPPTIANASMNLCGITGTATEIYFACQSAPADNSNVVHLYVNGADSGASIFMPTGLKIASATGLAVALVPTDLLSWVVDSGAAGDISRAALALVVTT